MKYLNKSITEIHELLKSKKLKPIDLVEEAFANIENNKEYNAYITLNKEEAIKQAKELESKEVDNLLFGLPIAVKDNIVTKGLLTTCGSHMLDNFVPIYDATVVEVWVHLLVLVILVLLKILGIKPKLLEVHLVVLLQLFPAVMFYLL